MFASAWSPRFTRRTAAALLTSLACVAALAGCGASGGGSAPATPALTIAPASLDFGTLALKTSGPALPVVATNTGTTAVSITSAASSGDFALTSNTCGSSLAAGASCTLTLVFSPTAIGPRTGMLSLATNAPGSPQTVALTGSGGIPQATLSPTLQSFGTVAFGGFDQQTVTLTNGGTAPLTIASNAATGDFSVANPSSLSNICGTSLAPGTSCVVPLVFTPSAGGTRTGTVTVMDNAAGSPQTASLSGFGGTPVQTLSSTSLAFGAVNLGSMSSVQTVLISSGSAPLNVSAATVTGDFVQTADTCPATLAANTVCSVSVLFKPTAPGSRTGILSLPNSLAGAPQSVTLSGTGVTPVTLSGMTFNATVLAGVKPIAGSSVQLFAAGTVGNGSAGTSLLTTPLITSASGTVTIPAGYVCPTASAQLYLLASGGAVGSSANPAIRLMSAIGSCSSVAPASSFTINEATTVASAFALAQFYGGGTAIGATGTNLTGLANAFATSATLADLATGLSPGSTLPANAASPAPRVDALANALNACVTSASACTPLFSATPAGTVLPTNTLDAAINLARNPAAGTAAIYTQSLLSTAYSPVIATAPADWTLYITYSGAGMNSPSGIGVDSTGSVWVANYFYVASKFTPQGSPIFANGLTGYGLNNSYGLAIDLNDTVWIPNELPFTSAGIGTVSSISTSGPNVTASGDYLNGGLNYPLSLAIDPNGTVWAVDYGNSHITLLDLKGNPLSGPSGYTTPLFAFPVAVAVDSNHYGWVVNQSSTFVTKVSADGTSFSNFNCCTGSSGVALDQQDNIWLANFYGDNVSVILNTGTVGPAGPFTGLASISRPQGIAIDGVGNVWVANYRKPYLTELAGTGTAAVGSSRSPATGLGSDARLLEAYALSIDASGNIWVANQGSNTITKFIGLAVPVKTPLSALPQLP